MNFVRRPQSKAPKPEEDNMVGDSRNFSTDDREIQSVISIASQISNGHEIVTYTKFHSKSLL